MSLDLEFDDAQEAIATTLEQFCRDRCTEDALSAVEGKFPSDLWWDLAELGVLGVASEEGGGGALEVAAAMEALGHAIFPGPLVASFFATQVLPEDLCSTVAMGKSVVALGAPPLMPWAPVAQLFIEIDGHRAWTARPVGEIEPVRTLGGEPWGRLELERKTELAGVERARMLADIARAAYLSAAGQRLVEDASAHARVRVQFGRPIGEFQAVAHPLADCATRLAAARNLARVAAFGFDARDATAGSTSSAARLSASGAALAAVYVCHQVFGAVGITLEGPVFRISQRVRQLVSLPPAPIYESLLADLGL